MHVFRGFLLIRCMENIDVKVNTRISNELTQGKPGNARSAGLISKYKYALIGYKYVRFTVQPRFLTSLY